MNHRKNNNNRANLLNEEIRDKELRVIDENGEQLGVISKEEALRRAENAGLDLVLISSGNNGSVAKILDYGKYLYEQQKKKKENKSNQKKLSMKEVRVSPTIDIGDYTTKLNQARKFLKAGHKVQFSLRFKGRMITHSEIGRATMNRIMEDLKDEVSIDERPRLDGRKMFLVVSPIKKK